ncbi:MAG: hypothetical protein INR69_16370 [Mucilaginibacter polytrichastri]|nr:hypothetical protein [Mucilaginibacter polytrichastri]
MSSFYEIRLCDAGDIEKVKHFIHTHWKEDHILSKNAAIMDFQHFEKDTQTYNYVIAINPQTQEVDGLMGFIPTWHFDRHLKDEKDYWGAIWKVRTDTTNPEIKLLGLDLFESFQRITGARTYGAIGVSSVAKKIYRALGYKTGRLNHYYILNDHIREFRVAIIKSRIAGKPLDSADNADMRLVDVLSGNEKIACIYKPQKTLGYILNRYQRHPVYKYYYLKVFAGDELVLIFVIRVISVHGVRIVRIVDLLGDFTIGLNFYPAIQNILTMLDAEYIDFVHFGMAEDVISAMGFTPLEYESGNIIPTYFEPFEQRNVIIEFAYKSGDPYFIFKGDSDQDRPNVL